MKTFFVTGTDTDVGKTTVSCAILNKLKLLGFSTLAHKPIAAGCELVDGELRNKDALLLQESMTATLHYTKVNPVALKQAIAPHIAADIEDINVDLELFKSNVLALQTLEEDLLLIEGAGGWLVPLNETQFLFELPVHLKMDVVLVVDMKLGCLNHALLSYQSIVSKGLTVCGWVANQTQSERMPFYNENIQTLKRLINAPCIATIPYLENTDAHALARYINTDCLITMCDKLNE